LRVRFAPSRSPSGTLAVHLADADLLGLCGHQAQNDAVDLRPLAIDEVVATACADFAEIVLDAGPRTHAQKASNLKPAHAAWGCIFDRRKECASDQALTG
jgi:hypothetical protein